MRRRATIMLHWSVLILLVLLVSTPDDAPVLSSVLAWTFALAGLGMVGLAVVFGLAGGPGPKLQGALRKAFPWMHRGLYALLAMGCGLTILDQMGAATSKGIDLKQIHVVLFGVAILHGIFHMWRHTALGDGALRRMTPRALHGIL